jgi:hypothetical protein
MKSSVLASAEHLNLFFPSAQASAQNDLSITAPGKQRSTVHVHCLLYLDGVLKEKPTRTGTDTATAVAKTTNNSNNNQQQKQQQHRTKVLLEIMDNQWTFFNSELL